ncbi:MAG TPA: 50S ribosomal protein L11, partial [Acidobacteriota bacterium]|nr:50S ribosomal protein L11 [Acidobacteriota bacterium]
GISSGSAKPNRDKVGKITSKQLREIAESKIQDMNCGSVEAAIRTIAGTARNMGLEIVD